MAYAIRGTAFSYQRNIVDIVFGSSWCLMFSYRRDEDMHQSEKENLD